MTGTISTDDGNVVDPAVFQAMFPKILFIISYGFFAISSIIGDFIITLPRCTETFMYLVAMADTSIHSLHAFLSWTMLWTLKLGRGNRILLRTDQFLIARDVCITAILSGCIDLDHVIMAGTFSIIDINRLTKRPFFHNTLLMLSISVALMILGQRKQPVLSWESRIGWLLLNATISHHLRDALRHGFLLYPFPSTPAVPLSFYYIIFFIFPIVMNLLQQWLGIDFGYTGNQLSNSNSSQTSLV